MFHKILLQHIFVASYFVARISVAFFLILFIIDLIRPGFVMRYFPIQYILFFAIIFWLISLLVDFTQGHSLIPYTLRRYVKFVISILCAYGVFLIVQRSGGFVDLTVPFFIGSIFFLIFCLEIR